MGNCDEFEERYSELYEISEMKQSLKISSNLWQFPQIIIFIYFVNILIYTYTTVL